MYVEFCRKLVWTIYQLHPQYSKLLGLTHPPTPLWNAFVVLPTEQTISMTIDNTSVFVPGGQAPQLGFRRGEFIAQPADPADGDHNAFNAASKAGAPIYQYTVGSVETVKLQS